MKLFLLLARDTNGWMLALAETALEALAIGQQHYHNPYCSLDLSTAQGQQRLAESHPTDFLGVFSASPLPAIETMTPAVLAHVSLLVPANAFLGPDARLHALLTDDRILDFKINKTTHHKVNLNAYKKGALV